MDAWPRHVLAYAAPFVSGSGPGGDSATVRIGTPIVALLIALLLGSEAVAASNDLTLSSFPPAGHLDYKITRDGDEVGFQSVEFIRNGEQLTVRTHARIVVTFLGIPLYRFIHEAEEQWMNGRLVSLTSRTDDDGEPRQVAFRVDGDRLHGTYNGRVRDFPATLIPASLWEPETVHQTALFDPIRGRVRQVTVVDKGEEALTINGRAVTAHHYAISEKTTRDIWYNSNGQLVQVRFFAKDGSEIKIVLR
jgi:hypothetical protein